MSGEAKGGGSGGRGPDKPTLPVAPPARTLPAASGHDRTHVDLGDQREVGLAHTIASTGQTGPGEVVLSAQLPVAGALGSTEASFAGAPAGPSIPHMIQPSPMSGSGAVAMASASGGFVTELVPGVMVGEYRVEGKLGEGGMGQVFAAIHPVIGKRAAIKVIKLELCANAEAVERFVQEARAVNQIGHANIVDVFAFGSLPDGRRYLVMEWLKGESLSARLKRQKLSVEEVCEILDPICRALEGAHEKRIIHRDLKPDNVFLCSVGSKSGDKPVVKLLDFGIAKLGGTEDVRLERTRTGSMLGTPAYISPEQARGRGVDERTDIYALGAMAFEMFTGRPPFDADNAMDMISSHLHDPPPAPCTVSPGLPAALDTLLLGMLEKEPAKRPSLERVRETLAEVKRAPLTTRATVRAEPPLVDLSAPAGAPAARTAPMAQPMPTEPIAGRGRNKGRVAAGAGVPGVPDAPDAATTANVRRGGAAKWVAMGVVVAAVAAGGVVMMRRGSGSTSSSPSAPVAAAAPAAVAPAAVAPAPAPAPAPEVEKPVATPTPTPGTLGIVVNVPDAVVEVGGQTVKATGGRASVSLAPGDYQLVVSAPGRRTVTKSLHVTEAAKLDEKVHLERGSGGGAAAGKVPAKKDPRAGAATPAGAKEPTLTDKPATPPKDPTKKPPGDDDTVW